MKQFLSFLCLLLAVALPAAAQNYTTAMGLRIEDSRLGITVQQRIANKASAELITAVAKQDLSVTLLGEYHWNILSKRLNYYMGAGGHLGYLKDYGSFQGVDAILGLEITIPAVPLNFSVDFKPAFHFHHRDWLELQQGVSIRYVVVSNKTWKEWQKKAHKRKKEREREKRKEDGKFWYF